MARYVLLLRASANRVFGESAYGLAKAELAAFEKAVRRITLATEELLAQLPPRQQPPPTLPPLRRIAARSSA